MDLPHLLEMIKQQLFGRGRKHRDAILLSFAIAHGDWVHGEVDLSSHHSFCDGRDYSPTCAVELSFN